MAIAIATACGCVTASQDDTRTHGTSGVFIASERSSESSSSTDASTSVSEPGSSSGSDEGSFDGDRSESTSDSSGGPDLGHGTDSTGAESLECRYASIYDGDGDLTALSDEFDDPASLCAWTFRHEVEGEPPQFDLFDVDETHSSAATMIPTPSGWYGDWAGPFLYKQVVGDFVVDAWVRAESLIHPGEAPIQSFTSTGLLARDPAALPAGENWIMVDLGMQGSVVGHEGKNTIDSHSALWTGEGTFEGIVRICRVGGVFRLLRRLADDPSFVTINEFVRPDLPPLLQVGIIVNAWNGIGSGPNFQVTPDLLATWDYVRFRTVDTLAGCGE